MASTSSKTSSPVKPATLSGFESLVQSATSNQVRMNEAMHGLWVGPMPVEQFLDDFLPLPGSAPAAPTLSSKFFAAMPVTKLEKEMYQPFINLVRNSDLIPGFKIINTSDHPDHDSLIGTKIKPDPTMYRTELDTSAKRTQFGKLELHFEFKADDYSDPFCDPDVDVTPDDLLGWIFEADGKGRSRCRGQLCSYVTEWSSRQHRCFAFTVFIGDPYVRFIRWDRAGAVVSRKFNYRENSQFLIDFLWRFTHLDDAGRGLDTTVRAATEAEVLLAEQELFTWKNAKSRPVLVLSIDHGRERRDFIVWGSMANARSLTGRSTRAYPAYEAKTKKHFFLKDTWRAHSLEKESAILNELNENGVENIPAFVCGDDIPGQVTLTDLYIPASDDGDSDVAATKGDSWRCGEDWKRITQRFHHRFIVDFIGKHLETFDSSKQMMQVVYDAFTAHRQAYEKCGIIHRDISARNILIGKNGRGILNDWDLARHESTMKHSGPRRHERTGTWQFMSTLLLMDLNKLHTIQDDIESFFHIVLYHGLRYLPHSLRPERVPTVLQEIFDYEVVEFDGISRGGSNKMSMFVYRDPLLGSDFHFSDNELLTEWVDYAFVAIKDWIEHMVAKPPRRVLTKVQAPKELDLRNHKALAEMFELVLSDPKWPVEDKAVDAIMPKLTVPVSRQNKRGHGVSGSSGGEDGSTGSSRKKTRTSNTGSFQPSVRSSLRHSMTDESS